MSLYTLRRQMDDLMNQMMMGPYDYDPMGPLYNPMQLTSGASPSLSSNQNTQLTTGQSGQNQLMSQENFVPGLIHVDVHENKDNFQITAELPGVSKDHVKISVDDGYLTIQGEKRQEKTEDKDEQGRRIRRSERRYGHFARSFRLPTACDQSKVKANFRDGVLFVDIPKIENQEQQRKYIDIE